MSLKAMGIPTGTSELGERPLSLGLGRVRPRRVLEALLCTGSFPFLIWNLCLLSAIQKPWGLWTYIYASFDLRPHSINMLRTRVVALSSQPLRISSTLLPSARARRFESTPSYQPPTQGKTDGGSAHV